MKESFTVKSKYLNSIFLDSAIAENILDSLLSGVSEFLQRKRLVTVFMDCPYANLKLVRLLKDHLASLSLAKIMETGVCSLHVVNGALGAWHKKVKWKVKPCLRTPHYPFFGYFI